MALITAAAGGGNWTAGGTWVGGVAPTAADDALLTATSGNVTINSGAVGRSLNCTGYTGTLTHTAAVTLTLGDGSAGSGGIALLLVSGMTYTLGSATTSAISFVSTSASQQSITWGGKTPGNVTFNGSGGSWQIADVWTASSTTVTLTRGSLDTNGQSCAWLSFGSSNSNTRSLTLGASTITFSQTGALWNTSGSLTLSAGSSTITMSGSTASFTGGGLTYGTVNLTGAGTASVSGANTFGALTRTGTAVKTDKLFFSSNQTITGTLTLSGNSMTNRLLVQSTTVGTNVTLSAATVTASNIDLMDITGAGAASWDLSGITGGSGNALGNSGITFTTPVTRYGVVAGNWSSTATWASSSGGSGGASVPLCHDTVILDANSAATTYTADMPRLCADLICTGFTRTLTFASISTTIYGSVTLASGMTETAGSNGTTLGGRSAHTITSAGKTFSQAISFTCPNGSYTLQDAFRTGGVLTLNAGTLDSGNATVECQSFQSNNSAVRSLLLGTSTITLNATGGTVWDCATSTNLVLSAASSTIVIALVGSGSRTFTGGGLTYGTLTYTVAGSTGPLLIAGGNTFGTINFSDANNARTLRFTSSTTTTVTRAFNVVGTAGKLMSVVAVTAGTAFTLAKTFGVVSCDYLSIQDSAATGGGWYAGANSTDVSGNSGWTFAAPKSLIYDRPTRRNVLIKR